MQPIVDNACAAADVLRTICSTDTILWREELLMLCLNSQNQLLNWYRVSIGGIQHSVADIRIIATIALVSTATRVILAHNHPCGSLVPSAADRATTERVRLGLGLLDIQLMDHIIITDTGHYSMKDAGLF